MQQSAQAAALSPSIKEVRCELIAAEVAGRWWRRNTMTDLLIAGSMVVLIGMGHAEVQADPVEERRLGQSDTP